MKLFGAAKGTFIHLALEKFQVTHSDNNLEASFYFRHYFHLIKLRLKHRQRFLEGINFEAAFLKYKNIQN